MKSSRNIAITVGVLFLIALILNLIASEIFKPILNVQDYLVFTYPNKNKIIIGNLLNFICAIAMIFIPITLFPIAKKNNENLAISYIVFRALEGILFIFIAIKTLLFISLSKEYQTAGTQTISILQTLGKSLQDEISWATNLYILIFTLGGISFYSLLFKAKLIPRVLSIWGIAAVLILLAGAVLGLFGLGLFKSMPLMEGMVYFAPPIALNEFVLSIWLIAKGFNSDIHPIKRIK